MKKEWRIGRFCGRFWREESGQTMFFAILSLFFLVTAIGYSYNVSLVVSRRIRLQNAADAAALSGAMVEANALSAIAWLNGCQTYIHARMQEIMLDIPYTATAAATAEWGRYIMNRFGSGDRKRNPVEMNHGKNRVGLISGLLEQFTSIIDNLFPEGGEDIDAERLSELLQKYYDPNTSEEEKKRLEQQINDEFPGFEIPSLDILDKTQEILDLTNQLSHAKEEHDKAFETVVSTIDRVQAKNYNACPEAKALQNKIVAVGNNVKKMQKSEDASRYHRDNTFDYILDGTSPWAFGKMVIRTKPSKWSSAYQNSIEGRIESVDSKLTSTKNSLTSARNKLTALEEDYKKATKAEDKQKIENEIADQNKIIGDLEKSQEELDACLKDLKALESDCKQLISEMDAVEYWISEVDRLNEEINKRIKEFEGDGSTGTKEEAEQKIKEITDDWNKKKKTTYYNAKDRNNEVGGVMNSPNDPPEPWSVFLMLPIPFVNPFGPDMNMGRMTPLGTALADIDLDTADRDDVTEALKGYSDKKYEYLKDGLPIWDELRIAFAGPFEQYLWPYIMQARYSLESAPDSMDGFFGFFHNTLVPEARKWIGYRRQSGKSFSASGVRPGEMWIRQLSQIAAAIATAMPKMVRNEIVYSIAVNASPMTRVAIYPDPDVAEANSMWGIAHAQTDAGAGGKFFRYDGWFTPPRIRDEDGKEVSWWIPPPNYVNMYTMANSYAPAIKNVVEANNPAVWADPVTNQLTANRFLNESRRQNMLTRTQSVVSFPMNMIRNTINQKLGSVPKAITNIINVDVIIGKVQEFVEKLLPFGGETIPSLAYSILVDQADEPLSETNLDRSQAYFRMNYDKSFYWDEYAGRVGGWDKTDGPGGSVRVAVQCWNQNDRMWRQPKADKENNNKRLFGLFEGFTNPLTLTPFFFPFMPYAAGHYSFKNALSHIMSPSQFNFNMAPRCQAGYAPGSNVFGLGHAMFVSSHGDPEKPFDAADGHWHYMHYHGHSIGCQVGYPGIGMCTAMLNCITIAAARFILAGVFKLGEDLGPVRRRTGWDSTFHYAYKHWDGTVVDDGAGDGGENAQNRHIYCRVATSYNFAEESGVKLWGMAEKLLGHGKNRQPPFSISLSKNALWGLIPPFSLYQVVGNCPQIQIPLIVITITLCQHFFSQHLPALFGGTLKNVDLHHHESCDNMPIIPKDALPLTSPYLFSLFSNGLEGDTDPSIITMFGAYLYKGDLQGDPFMGLGSGDRYFYPEILYLRKDATGRKRKFTTLNSPVNWIKEIAGTGLNLAGDIVSKLQNFNFIGDDFQDALENLPGLVDDSGVLEEFEKETGNEGAQNPFETQNKVLPDKAVDKDRTYKYFETSGAGAVANEVLASIVDLVVRWGHHRFMTCPLCMSNCPLDCDAHSGWTGPVRHWGGDYGGAKLTDLLPGNTTSFGGIAGVYYKVVGFMSLLPGLLSTGDQRTDAGMSYANVLRGHDFSPAGGQKEDHRENPDWWGTYSGKKDWPTGNSSFDLGVDLDDGLQGLAPDKNIPSTLYDVRPWYNSYPTDRFIREWMTPRKDDLSGPNMALAPTIVMTENFMRHAITVVAVEDFWPILWMFGTNSRPMMAVASAKCGFIERPDVYAGATKIVIDGLGQGTDGGDGADAVPQIIAGVNEPDGGSSNRNTAGVWNLDALWNNFLDFPNSRPLGESNLYYSNWGAKMIPTSLAVLVNSRDNTNSRRNNLPGVKFYERTEAQQSLWYALGDAQCYRGDGRRFGTLKAFCRMSDSEWRQFVNDALRTSADAYSAIIGN